jgi:hypothetical protein
MNSLSKEQREVIEAAVRKEVECWLAPADDHFRILDNRVSELERRVQALQAEIGIGVKPAY